jgi:hypothetical protein
MQDTLTIAFDDARAVAGPCDDTAGEMIDHAADWLCPGPLSPVINAAITFINLPQLPTTDCPIFRSVYCDASNNTPRSSNDIGSNEPSSVDHLPAF